MEESSISKVSKAESFNKSTKALSKSKVGAVTNIFNKLIIKIILY
jgi:hypothetical protein